MMYKRWALLYASVLALVHLPHHTSSITTRFSFLQTAFSEIRWYGRVFGSLQSKLALLQTFPQLWEQQHCTSHASHFSDK